MIPDFEFRPSVLVVMPLYDAGKFVESAVESILSQTYPDYGLLIIDDGSTDGSADLVKRFLEKRVVVAHQPHGGPGAAMNRAIQYANEKRIPFIARMDADDLSLPARLDVQVGILSENKDVAACSSNCYYIDSETEEIIGSSTVALRHSIIKWEIENGLRGLIQGSSLFRTAALLEVGGYRTQFQSAEDTDLFLRLAEKFQLMNAGEYLYKIRLHKDSLSMSDVEGNVQYHFYALECSRKRKAGEPEGNFEAFVEGLNWRSRTSIRHMELVLKLWRSGMARRNYFLLLLASFIDPRRAIARLLRKLTV